MKSFFDGFELGDSGSDLTEVLSSTAKVLALDQVDMKDFYETVAGKLVRPVDGTLWEIKGDRLIQVSKATNVVEI